MSVNLRNFRRKMLESMGEYLQDSFSTSYLDIRRQIGSIPDVEVYSNIPVHSTRRDIDNSDPSSVSNTPVIVNYTIHAPIESDIRSGDIFIIKLTNSDNKIISAFRGTSGEPIVVNSRKRSMSTVRQLSSDDIINDVTPPPPIEDIDPIEYSIITMEFIEDTGIPIRANIIYNAPILEPLKIEALVVHGYNFESIEFEGTTIIDDFIEFTPQADNYTIKFIYSSINVPFFLRCIVNGRFRRTNGTLVTTGNLLHAYRRINFRYIDTQDNIMTISISVPPLLPDGSIVHLETREIIQFRRGLRVMIFPDETFWTISTSERIGDEYLITMNELIPDASLSNLTITEWYDYDI